MTAELLALALADADACKRTHRGATLRAIVMVDRSGRLRPPPFIATAPPGLTMGLPRRPRLEGLRPSLAIRDEARA